MDEATEIESRLQAKNWEKLNLEMISNLEKWKPVGMLAGLDDHEALITAYLLENQRLFNENADMPDISKRISLPLVRRMFDPNKFIGWQLVSIQAMRGPQGPLKTTWQGSALYLKHMAKTRNVKVLVYPTLYQNPDPNGTEEDRIEKEANAVAGMAAELAQEFNNEILSDLRNNVATRGKLAWTEKDGAAPLWRALSQFRQSIMNKTGFLPNWVVTSPEAAALLKEVTEVQKLEYDPDWWISPTAKLNDELLVIEDKLQKDVGFLVGYKGNPYSSQYIWAPYIPFTTTPVILDAEGFNAKRGMLFRYAKRLLSQTDNYYGTLRTEASK
jgi:hypothetical protein